jgi:hypothetical protein
MILLALASLFLPAFFGFSLFSALKLFSEKITLIAAGAIAGLTFYVITLYSLSVLIPLNPLLIGLTLFIFTLGGGGLIFPAAARRHFLTRQLDYSAFFLLLGLVTLVSLLAPRYISLEENGLVTNMLNTYGDLGWHVAAITNFAHSPAMPPQNPVFAGHTLIYPFLADFHSATLINAGASLVHALTLPAVFLIPLFFTLLYCLVRDLSHSQAGLLTVLLFLFSGATLGFLRFFWPPSYSFQDYSGFGSDPDYFHFLNPLLALFFPQRSFLFGFPLAILILYLLAPLRQRASTTSAVIAGLLAGLLPLFHAHTVLALIPLLLSLFLFDLKHWKRWLLFAIIALSSGLPQIIYYLQGNLSSESFFKFSPGWTYAGGENPLWFWLKNTGLIFPALIAAFLTPAPRLLKQLAGGGLAIFLAANLFLFAPWVWDNFKLLIFWLLFSLPLVAWLWFYLWQKSSWLWRPLLLLALALQLTSAGLDLTKLITGQNRAYKEWDQAAITAARALQVTLPPGSALLAAPSHNNLGALAGYPVYLGHPAHVWSHGGDQSAREHAVPLFYNGTLNTLPEFQPAYVLVGPTERYHYPNLVIQPHWELILESGPYQVYKL